MYNNLFTVINITWAVVEWNEVRTLIIITDYAAVHVFFISDGLHYLQNSVDSLRKFPTCLLIIFPGEIIILPCI